MYGKYISLHMATCSLMNLAYRTDTKPSVKNVLELSISDVIVTQKGSNGDGKLHFYVGTILVCEKCHFLKRQMKEQSTGL